MPASVWEYAGLARRKLEVARRHLMEFDNEYPNAMVIDPASATDSRAELEGHADGVLMQAYAAFDTFACGVAAQFGLPSPDKASFNGLAARLESLRTDAAANLVTAVRNVAGSDGWERLSYYRNHAGHRGVLLQRTKFSLDDGFKALIGDFDSPYHPNRSEVRPILVELLEWAEGALPPLLEHLNR